MFTIFFWWIYATHLASFSYQDYTYTSLTEYNNAKYCLYRNLIRAVCTVKAFYRKPKRKSMMIPSNGWRFLLYISYPNDNTIYCDNTFKCLNSNSIKMYFSIELTSSVQFVRFYLKCRSFFFYSASITTIILFKFFRFFLNSKLFLFTFFTFHFFCYLFFKTKTRCRNRELLCFTTFLNHNVDNLHISTETKAKQIKECFIYMAAEVTATIMTPLIHSNVCVVRQTTVSNLTGPRNWYEKW